MKPFFRLLALSAATGALLAPAGGTRAQLPITGNDEKVSFDETGKTVTHPGKDTVNLPSGNACARARAEGTSSASLWTSTRVPRNAGFLPVILPINRSLVGARVERFSSARRRRGARFEKQSKKIKRCKVDGHVVDPIGTNRTLGPL